MHLHSRPQDDPLAELARLIGHDIGEEHTFASEKLDAYHRRLQAIGGYRPQPEDAFFYRPCLFPACFDRKMTRELLKQVLA